MFGIPLAFASPIVLAGLLALPALWWLLRVTPPRPRRIDFPPLKIMADLLAKRETPARTPWWLLLLRMAIAALAILAMAGPVLNPPPSGAGDGRGPLVLVVDNGPLAARDWSERIAVAEGLLGSAQRDGRATALVGLAEAPAGLADEVLSTPAETLEKLRALPVQAHMPSRMLHLPALEALLQRAPDAEIAWLSDGVMLEVDADFARRLGEIAGGRLLAHLATGEPALFLAAPENQVANLSARVMRARAGMPLEGTVRALDGRGLAVGEAPFRFAPGDTAATATFELPIELRNAVTRLDIAGERSAGAVLLLDDRARRKRVGVVTGVTADTAQPLLSPAYYLNRALAPYADLREPRPGSADPIGQLLEQNLSMLVLADIGGIDRDTIGKLDAYLEKGGVILRFAGPRLAATSDELTPVRLRRGGRSLGGSLSWDTPRTLAPFERESPFEGLTPPEEVRISRQILAEPDGELSRKVWASLADGTPVVTAERRGDGLLVLFHVTADTTWSDLPLSGLFVDMLRRVLTLAGSVSDLGETGEARIENVSPTLVLDGQGAFRSPPAHARPIPRNHAERASYPHPPGFYGPRNATVAVNVLLQEDRPGMIDFASAGIATRAIDGAGTRDLRPPLLVAALILLLLDTLLTLWLAGRLWGRGLSSGRAAPAALVLSLALAGIGAALGPVPAAAQAPAPPAVDAPRETPREAQAALPPVTREQVAAALTTRLAYVTTGDRRVDDTSRAGLEGLTLALSMRTALEPGEPTGIDPSRDELALYPILYWPVVAGRPLPSADTVRRLDAFMKGGGFVIFDTRDAVGQRNGRVTPESEHLRLMLQTLDIPEIEPVPRDHVLTKTFYLIDGFPGRYDVGQTWVEVLPPPGPDGRGPARAGDGVSPLVITSNDLAVGWAVDRRGNALFPLEGSTPRQREMSLRAGVNLVMYALTGNYKADQVHVPALLERLGQ